MSSNCYTFAQNIKLKEKNMANNGSLSLENLIDPEELFRISGEDSFVEDEPAEPSKKEEPKGNDIDDTHQVIDGGDGSGLFDPQESVDDNDDKNSGDDTDPTKSQGSSPNIYSSIAKDFKEDGVFPDLTDEDIEKLNTPEGLSELINKQIQKKIDDSIDETQKRVRDALNANVEPSEINKYESMIKYLDSIKDSDIEGEDDQKVQLRQNLIYRDLRNRGYSDERAKRAVKRSFDNGTDLDDAKDALAGNKEFFSNEYNKLIANAKAEQKRIVEEREAQMEEVKKAIMDDKPIIGDYVIPKEMRQSVYDSISRPVYKDPETGEMLSAVQKYANDNHYEFLKMVGIMYTLTDGFKNMNGLINKEVNKQTKKSLKNLTDALNGTTRNSDGSFRLANGLGDKETYSGSDDWTLDV